MFWQVLYHHMRHLLMQLTAEDDESNGQGLVEYALILMMVAVVVVAIATILGPGVGNIYSNIVAVLGGNPGG